MILLTSLALAADPPPRPSPIAPLPNECPRAIAVTIGQRPADLVDDRGVARCGGVLVPSSVQADLLQIEAWAEHLDARYRIDAAGAAAELDAARSREAWWRAQAERLRVEPAILVGAGVLGGVAVTLGAAWALGEVAE